jgi:DnaJ-class molecular chaperone
VPEAKRDYYEVLGVARTADLGEIRTAFRRLARDCHPDVNPEDPGAEARFKECAEAWEVLSDREKREAYDLHGLSGLRGRPMPDFQSAGFRDLYNAYFGTDDLGMPLHPVFMYQQYLREYLKQRNAGTKTGEAETT